ncbi:hypothetical protein ACFSRY_14595 [Pontibacter locisalis]|uniref:Viral A-type inclusion protein n=1 Tax=Pontibacter locisalis TaxID=1719035 RepID=A0ABW5INR6_9BACT
MKYFILLISFAVAMLGGCNQGEKPEEQKKELEDQVMEVHDSAMAKMSTIYHLRRDIRALRDTLESQQVDTAQLAPLYNSILQLNEADEAMMNWMRQYKAPVSLSHEQAMSYLQNEMVKIKRVKNFMDTTIIAAQQTYEKYRQNEAL